MSDLSIRKMADGTKNAIVNISGLLTAELPQTDIVVLRDLADQPKGLKIESFVFAIQEKMGFYLWWRKGKETALILPLESRGGLSFEGMQCLHSPEGTEAIAMSSFGWAAPKKGFLLLLDMVKQ